MFTVKKKSFSFKAYNVKYAKYTANSNKMTFFWRFPNVHHMHKRQGDWESAWNAKERI